MWLDGRRNPAPGSESGFSHSTSHGILAAGKTGVETHDSTDRLAERVQRHAARLRRRPHRGAELRPGARRPSAALRRVSVGSAAGVLDALSKFIRLPSRKEVAASL